MLFGKIFAIISCFLYMTIELVGVDSRRAFFIAFELLLGFSVGKLNLMWFLKLFRRCQHLPNSRRNGFNRGGSTKSGWNLLARASNWHLYWTSGTSEQSKILIHKKLINKN
jgi:hypothetical protein